MAAAALLRIPTVRPRYRGQRCRSSKNGGNGESNCQSVHYRYPRDGVVAASFHAAVARASYIYMRCDFCCADELRNVDRRGRILEQIKQLGLFGGAGLEEDMLQMRARRYLTDPKHFCGILDPEAWGDCQ